MTNEKIGFQWRATQFFDASRCTPFWVRYWLIAEIGVAWRRIWSPLSSSSELSVTWWTRFFFDRCQQRVTFHTNTDEILESRPIRMRPLSIICPAHSLVRHRCLPNQKLPFFLAIFFLAFSLFSRSLDRFSPSASIRVGGEMRSQSSTTSNRVTSY